MKEMSMEKINQTEVKNLFIYRDGKLFWRNKPSRKVAAGVEAGSLNSTGVLQVKLRGQMLLTHRLIYLYHHGVMPRHIHHHNGDLLDNRIENLEPSERSGLDTTTECNVETDRFHNINCRTCDKIARVNVKYRMNCDGCRESQVYTWDTWTIS